jgi:putative ABC transport system permease protein
MSLLQLISWPYCRKHVLRTLLTVVGVVLGVGVFVGLHAANESVRLAFNSTIDRIAGKTDLQITAGEAGFPEAVLEAVQASAAVRVAVPVVEAVVDSRIRGEGSLLVVGVDMTGDRSLRDYDLDEGDEAVIDDPLVFLAQPDSIILAREFARRNRLSANNHVTLKTALGDRRFTIRGILSTSGMSSAYGGNLAIMDVYAAQKMFGRGRSFDRIDLTVRPGVPIAEAREQLRALLGSGFQIDLPSERGQQFEAMTAAYSVMMSVSSLFALLIGMFIIHNSFGIAVTQRRSEIGIMRALGASRAQIRSLFLAESAAIGAIGSIIGIGLGLLLAQGIAAVISTVMQDVYGLAQHAARVSGSWPLLGGSLVVGVITSVVAALVPAQQAARVDPVKSLQKGRFQVLSAGEYQTRVVAARFAEGCRSCASRPPTGVSSFTSGVYWESCRCCC